MTVVIATIEIAPPHSTLGHTLSPPSDSRNECKATAIRLDTTTLSWNSRIVPSAALRWLFSSTHRNRQAPSLSAVAVASDRGS